MSKNLQDLIDYLEAVKKEIGGETKIKLGSIDYIEDFEDCIFVDHVKDEITIYQY